MRATYLSGFFWIFVAGVTQGAFPLPMKFTRRWKWEHLWFWYSAIAFFILPLALAIATVPNLVAVYLHSPGEQLFFVALFGIGWGAGSVLFGLGLDALGMALGFPLMTGLFTALGALIPLVVLTPDLVLKRSGLLTIAGNVVTIFGVAVCGIAGRERDKKLGDKIAGRRIGPKHSFTAGLVICVLGGVLSSLFNFGYAFGSKITDTAISLGAPRDSALNAMWLIELSSGGLINIGYCVYLFRKNQSWKLVGRASPVDWLGACIMGLLWTASVIFYGWGANHMGRLGPTLGWSLWNAILMATTIVCGLLTGEWEGARGRPLRLLFMGITLLLMGLFTLGMGA